MQKTLCYAINPTIKMTYNIKENGPITKELTADIFTF